MKTPSSIIYDCALAVILSCATPGAAHADLVGYWSLDGHTNDNRVVTGFHAGTAGINGYPVSVSFWMKRTAATPDGRPYVYLGDGSGTPGSRVVILSQFEGRDCAEQASACGALTFVSKERIAELPEILSDLGGHVASNETI